MSDDSVLPTPSSKAFAYRSYRLFWFNAVANSFAGQILAVAVAWQVYDITRNPLHLGLIGLAQFLPALLLVLVTGMVSDRFNRRVIISICLVAELGCAAAFLWFALTGIEVVWPIFAVLVVLGLSRSFMRPAEASLAPNLVPPEALSNAVALSSSAWQLATVVGPMMGGLLYGISAGAAYGTAFAMVLVAFTLVIFIPKPAQKRSEQAKALDEMLAGFRYIWRQKIVFGAITLDLFAVLLGGAVALLPVYARDILDTGPWGLGLLRAAPGVGGILVAIAMTRIPIRDHAGRILLIFVALFGLFTTIFGLSTSVWVAVPALLLVGATDMVSVVIRETMMQLWTPDDVRGRVNAINTVFIGASNELGDFRAGIMAFWMGTVAAVTIGGAATMGVAATWAYIFPQMRDVRTLDKAGV